jgi:hypothetical protein
LEARFAHAWQLRDGRAIGFEQITDTARWNQAQRRTTTPTALLVERAAHGDAAA